jgi:hypothetical protein
MLQQHRRRSLDRPDGVCVVGGEVWCEGAKRGNGAGGGGWTGGGGLVVVVELALAANR